MSNDPADKLAAPSFGFKKKRGGTKPTNTKAEKAPAEKAAPEKAASEKAAPEKTQVLEKTAPPVIAPEPPAEKPARKPAEKPKKPKAQKPPKPAKEPKPPKPPKEPSERRINLGTPSGLSAAVMIGAIVGAFMALAVWFSGTVSQWTRGTSSLGDTGAIVLIAVFVLAVALGGYLLRLAGARSPFTISFLGSALVAVLSMLFLTELFNYAWGVIIAVILTAAAYALAYWVTTTYID
ncbi:hypothetical protein G5C66_20695 [Nocardioides sp. KC13]|uniref:Uncharacterized protein n=1 Tax=Nocardioides turkmenicus TaxID=2711220 RepID=A0A6M1R4G3_9ACTN|nr:hypothetical protein [Nocardioides sp. KC13]NGN95144.1 hypothetical protein [Nocardioides sp. KC13]